MTCLFLGVPFVCLASTDAMSSWALFMGTIMSLWALFMGTVELLCGLCSWELI